MVNAYKHNFSYFKNWVASKTVGALRGEFFGYYIDKTKIVGSLKTIIQLIFLKISFVIVVLL